MCQAFAGEQSYLLAVDRGIRQRGYEALSERDLELMQIRSEGFGQGYNEASLFRDGQIARQQEKIAGLERRLADALKALQEVVAISDRKHDAWDGAHAIIDAEALRKLQSSEV